MSGIPSWAVRGARVACINTGPLFDSDGRRCIPDTIVVGATYTIRKVIWWNGDLCVYLREVRRKREWVRAPFGYREWPFLIQRFQPPVDSSSAREIEADIFRLKGRHLRTTQRETERA